MKLLGGDWNNGTSASFKMKQMEYPKCTKEYLKVASVIESCITIKQLVPAINMIYMLERKHECEYSSLHTLVQTKINKIVGEYV